MTKFNIRLLTFSRKLFLSVITLFVAFAACFMLFQYQREKSYKTELLNTQLQNYNEQLYSYMADAGSLDSLKNYIMTHMIPNLRVTIITPEGKVIFDSTDKNLDRQEPGRIPEPFFQKGSTGRTHVRQRICHKQVL